MKVQRDQPTQSIDLGPLLAIHDAAASVAIGQSDAVKVCREALEAAEKIAHLAESNLWVIRQKIRDRYVELGLKVPAMFHAWSCSCAECRPLPETDLEEHA